jgi:hypothetical protein
VDCQAKFNNKGLSDFTLSLLTDPEAEVAMKQNLKKDFKTALLRSIN